MSFIERLEKLLKDKSISQKELAETINIRRPTISDWKRNKTFPYADIAVEIACILDTTVEYLITGKSPTDIDPEILKIANKIAALSPHDREEIMLVINHKLGRYPEAQERAFFTDDTPPLYRAEITTQPEIKVIRPSKFDNNVVSINYDIVYTPFYGKTAAGKPISFDSAPEGVVPWSKKMIKGDPSKHYTVEVKGNSMINANIEDGDYVLVRHAEAPKHNSIMLIRHENDSTIKRIKIKGEQEVYMAWDDGSGRIERLDNQEYEIQGEYMGVLRG